jgi:hypothetical protein
MTAATETGTRAWQPLTPGGVAAFAAAPFSRLLLVQLVFATVAAAVVVWFLNANCFPVITEAIRQLPSRGEIVDGRLAWPKGSPLALAEGNFLAFTVDLNHAGGARTPAQLEIEFGRESAWMVSLFGYLEYAYPKDWIIEFNRPELEARWGAWKPPLLWLSAGAAILGLMAMWVALATVYFPVVWLAGFLANRGLNAQASWKLAGAALMPGALLATVGIALYGVGVLDLVKCLAIVGAHFVLGWVYLLISPFRAPRFSPAVKTGGNPFAAASD